MTDALDFAVIMLTIITVYIIVLTSIIRYLTGKWWWNA